MLPRRFQDSLSYAWYGIRFAVRTERNMRVHLACSVAVFGAAAVLGCSRTEWIVLWLTVTLVLMAELVNTALEVLVDLLSQERRAKAKIIKDVAAGAVLMCSLNAVIVGVLLFLPKLVK